MSHAANPPADAGPEQALVARAMGGDSEAFGQLFEVEYAWGFGVACLLTHHSAEAQDLVMDAWVRAWEHREAFDGFKPFRPWFGTVLLNLWRSEWRRQQRQPQQSLDALLQPPGATRPLGTILDDSQLSPESYVSLWHAWSTLRDDQRELLLLRFSVGYSRQAIAHQWPARWGATPQSVGNHERRAMAPLRESLASGRPLPPPEQSK